MARSSKTAKTRAKATPDGLTLKQHQFIDAYLGEANGNATEAARIAGYALPGIQGHENLKKPYIRKIIDTKLGESAMSSAEVLARLSAIARSSLGDFINVADDGSYKLDLRRSKITGKLPLLKSIKPTRDGVMIELHDPQAALTTLAKYHGLFAEKPPASPAADLPDDMTLTPDDDDRPEPPPAR